MRLPVVIALLLALGGCGSIPLPAGWVSQDTVQQQNLDALAGKIIEKIQPPAAINVCSALQPPSKFARSAEVSNYYIAMAGCLASVEPPPPDGSFGALREIEQSRRKILSSSGERARLVAESLLGVARLGVDLEIASKDRESRERIADAENSSSGLPSISVGGDYVVGDGSSGSTSSVDNSSSDSSVDSSGSTSSVDSSSSDSSVDSSGSTSSVDNSSSDSSVDSSGSTSSVDSSSSDSSVDSSGSTTTSTVDNRVDNSSADNRVDNRVYGSEEEEDEAPVVDDLHAQCYLEADTDLERVQCNVQYQNSERRVAYRKCDTNGWERGSDECLSEITDRDTWAERMGLVWNSERQTYVLPPSTEEEEETETETREIPGA